MDKLITRITLGLAMLAFLVGGLYFKGQPVEETPMQFDAVSETNKYRQFTGSIATTTVLKGGSAQAQYPGNFHGVIITEDAATAVVFYDATSTSYLPASARIADFEASAAEGEYIFDAGFTYGLVMQSTDGFTFAGDWTVLWN